MRVLIAEDDRISQRLLQKHLERWGHEVVTAADGVQAWERFCEDEFSLVITDWMMPEMDGLGLIRRIRKAQGRGYVYVILLTAKKDTGDIVKGMEAGADDFLSKPFDQDELRVRVKAGRRIIELERRLDERNAELQSANQHMKRGLEAAAVVQQSLLPAALPDVPGVKLAWSFRPCEELAGDFLNVLPLDKRHLALYVADVSGHGVVASLLSVTISHTLTAQNSTSSLLKRQKPDSSETEIVSPSEVVKELNERFPMEDSGGTYFTLVYGILDVQTREFRYISAGHPPIVRLPRDSEPEFLKAGGFAVGWETDFDYDEYVVRLESGDRLCIYSDGVPEALNSQLESFTDKRMLEVLRRNRSEDLHTATENLLQAVEQWCGESQPKDDVSILALEVE
jgi:sigma-B regulation protein RsbU (phosphoserine phosphatase)